MTKALEKARQVKLLVLDVDGVLSDGSLLYGNSGEETKAFYTPDGQGIKLLQSQGVTVAIITGRKSEIVSRRAQELGIENLVQGRDDKLSALNELLENLGLELTDVAYMGDDLPDLSAIQACQLGMTVADGDEFVAAHADWRSQRPGGRGAVREACEFILAAQGKLEDARARFLADSATTTGSKLSSLVVALLLGFSLLLASDPVTALPEDTDQPIRITTDEAVRDEKSGRTVYSGNVELVQGTIRINADKVTFYRIDQEGDKIVAEGSPATMQQQPEIDGPLMHAKGNIIEYYRTEERVQLREDAVVEQDGSTVRGDKIDYFIREQRVKAATKDSNSNGRVEVIIPPRKTEE